MEAAAAVQDGGTLLVGHAQVVRGRGCDGRDGPPARGAWCMRPVASDTRSHNDDGLAVCQTAPACRLASRPAMGKFHFSRTLSLLRWGVCHEERSSADDSVRGTGWLSSVIYLAPLAGQ